MNILDQLMSFPPLQVVLYFILAVIGLYVLERSPWAQHIIEFLINMKDKDK